VISNYKSNTYRTVLYLQNAQWKLMFGHLTKISITFVKTEIEEIDYNHKNTNML
jgi:hypothetical protein